MRIQSLRELCFSYTTVAVKFRSINRSINFISLSDFGEKVKT